MRASLVYQCINESTSLVYQCINESTSLVYQCINESTSLVYQCIKESKSGCILSQFDIVMLGGRRVTVTWHHQNVSN